MPEVLRFVALAPLFAPAVKRGHLRYLPVDPLFPLDSWFVGVKSFELLNGILLGLMATHHRIIVILDDWEALAAIRVRFADVIWHLFPL